MDREKVVKWLDFCIRNKDGSICECEMSGCPYFGGSNVGNCFVTLMNDALALLKAQEPRVISWQDAESMRLCWIETRYPHTISPADLIHYFDESPTITVFKIHQNAIDWPLDEYGIKWRCWDNEPTNEQMEEAKWE